MENHFPTHNSPKNNKSYEVLKLVEDFSRVLEEFLRLIEVLMNNSQEFLKSS